MKYLSVVIAYYKNPAALSLIIKALERQSYQNFEIIIAEDDKKSDFDFLVNQNLKHKIKHVFQSEDTGFRKNAALNKALAISEGNHLVFIDGDCIPHHHFLKAYSGHLTDENICFGRRVMISPKLTSALYHTGDLGLLNFTHIFFSGSKRLKYMIYLPFIIQKREKGIWGHNWGVAKKHLLDINGFDEDYQTAGVGEDVDVEWRLLSRGLKLYSIRFAAIQFHLHHKENYNNDDVQTGKKMLLQKQKDGFIRCKNGLIK